MVKSSQSESSTSEGLESRARARLRARAGSTVAIASVLLSTWSALSCGAKSDPGATQTTEDSAKGGGSGTNTFSNGGAGTGTSSIVASGSGGRSQQPTTAGTSKPITGGASSTASGGAPTSASTTGGGNATSALAAGGTTAVAHGGSSSAVTSSLIGGAGGTSSAENLGSAGQTSTAPDPGSSALAARLNLLRSSSVWQSLQLLWRQIDAVTPSTSTYVPYANTISLEQHDKWLGDLDVLLTTVERLGFLTADEILFLRQVTTARVEVMRDGGYHYEMVFHRSPMPFEGEAETSIGQLEKKIDTLISLRDRCMIDVDAYQLALEQVEREATSLFVLAQLSEVNPTYEMRTAVPTDLQDTELAAEIGRRLEALRAASTDQATRDKLDAMQARLTTIQGTVTSLHMLVQMLEACE